MKKIIKSLISIITLTTTIMYLSPVYAFESKETVYSKLDSTGKAYSTIITTKDKENNLQEDSNKELPLEVKVSYELNGKQINSEDLKGKSGKVKIKIEYVNKSAKEITINGKKETIYTPFIVALGTIIDNKNNKNIEVSKAGKIIENGEKTIIVGTVFPGLDESLRINNNLIKIEIPSSLEIEMDTECFEMKNIITYSTPRVFQDTIDWSIFDDLFDKSNELKNSTDKIEKGAKSLSTGISTLKKGSETLDKGASKINEGAKTLDNGIDSLKQGTNALSQGADSLNGGLKELQEGISSAGKGIINLKDGSGELENGAKNIDKGANDLKDGIDTLNNKIEKLPIGMKTVDETVKQLDEGASKVYLGLNSLSKELETYAKNKDKLQNLINKNTLLKNSLPDDEENKELKELLTANIATLEGELDLLNQSSKITDLVDGANKVSKGLSQLHESTKELPEQAKNLSEGVKELLDGSKKLTSGTNALSEGATNLKKGAGSLAEGTKELDAGTSKLVDGSNTLAKGTRNVKQGAEKLSKGSKELTKGTKNLSNGTKELSNGTKDLDEGAKTLSSGIHKFNIEAITKITNFIDGELKDLINRGMKLEELSKEYNSFSENEKREEISFVSIIDSIKKEEDEK